MNKKTLILTFIVFIFAFSVRCFWFSQKGGIHTDEGFTIVVSQNNEYGFTKYFDENKTYLGKELKQITYGADNSVKGIVKSLKDLRYHNNGDTPHPNLYYSLFRISQIHSDSSNLQNTLTRGFYLNLIIFTLSFFFMFKLLNVLNFDKKYIPFILAIAYLNTGSISMCILNRSYLLQEMAFVFLAFAFTTLYKTDKINTFKNFVLIAISIATTLLSGYYGLIFTSILGLILLIKKSPKWFLLMGFTAAIGLVFLIYPNYLDFIYAPRVGLADNSLLSNFTQTNFTSFIFYAFEILWNYLFYSIVVIAMIFAIIKEHKFVKDNVLTILISTCAFCFIFFLLGAPQKVMRYTEPLFPILSLIIPVIILETTETTRKILIILTSFVFVFNSLLPSKFESYDSMINPARLTFTRGVIENLFTNTDCTPIEKSTIPIFITEKNGWNILNIIPYFKDEQPVKIDYSDDPNLNYNHFILLFTEKSLIIPNEMKIVKEFSCQRFKGYELKK